MAWDPAVEAFLDERRYGVLATPNADGTIQQTVMWYKRDGDVLVMNTKFGRKKHRNMARAGWASLCMEEGEVYVTVSGRIEIDEDREKGQSGMRAMSTRYEGAEEAERLMREEYAHQHRIVITLIPERIETHGFDN